MSINLGSTNLTAFYLGSTSVSAIYLGATQVFSSAPAGEVYSEVTWDSAADTYTQDIYTP